MYSAYWRCMPHYDSLLASPAQLFPLKAVDFSVAFLFQFQVTKFLNPIHIGLFRHCCRGSGARYRTSEIDLLSGDRGVSIHLCFMFHLLFQYHSSASPESTLICTTVVDHKVVSQFLLQFPQNVFITLQTKYSKI